MPKDKRQNKRPGLNLNIFLKKVRVAFYLHFQVLEAMIDRFLENKHYTVHPLHSIVIS